MRRSDFLLSLVISRLLFAIPEIIVLLVFSHFAFGVVNHGSYLAIGLHDGSQAVNQGGERQQADQG